MADAIITLDLGTNLGWALQRKDGKLLSGSQNFRPAKSDRVGHRPLRIRSWLMQMHKEHRFTELAYEKIQFMPGPNGFQSAQVHGGILWTVTAWCEFNQIPYEGYGPSTIRKHVFGNGRMKKADALSQLRLMGYEFNTGDEGDAIAVLLHHTAQHRQRSLIEAAE